MEATILLHACRQPRARYPDFVVTFYEMTSAIANPARAQRSRSSIVIGAAVRVLLFAITCTGLGMAVGLFSGIVVQVLRSVGHHGALDMTVAYRYFAIPLAVVLGIAAPWRFP